MILEALTYLLLGVFCVILLIVGVTIALAIVISFVVGIVMLAAVVFMIGVFLTDVVNDWI